MELSEYCDKIREKLAQGIKPEYTELVILYIYDTTGLLDYCEELEERFGINEN